MHNFEITIRDLKPGRGGRRYARRMRAGGL